MATISISLSDSDLGFVQRQVAIGRFSNLSEYFQALVRAERLLEQEPAGMSSELEALLLEGLNSGPATRMTDADWEEMRNRAMDRYREATPKHKEP